jgi:heme exporter protein C
MSRLSRPVHPPSERARPGRRLGIAAGLTALVALLFGLLLAPPDAVQGQPQRLMYLHVPSAWTAFACFGVVCVASLAVLLGRGRRSDAVAQAAAELGVVMTALTIAEGSIWGHSAWGVWWTWDPRLVTTAFLLLVYVAYLALRSLPGEPRRVHRRAAIAGVVFVVQVPVVHFSVLWWRTLHQPPTLLQPSLSPPIAPMMLVALLLSLAASTLAGAWFVVRRVHTLSAPSVPPAPAAATAPAVPVAAHEVGLP